MALLRTRRSRIISIDRDSIRSQKSVVAQVKEVWDIFLAHHANMMVIDAWKECRLDDSMMPIMPDEATDEFKKIRQNAPTPWGRLIVDTLTQSMFVDDVKLKDGTSAPAYQLWQQNGQDAWQIALHDSMATYGQAYNLILPAVGRLDKKRTAQIAGQSSLDSLAFYRDTRDDYPEFWIKGVQQVNDDGTSVWRITFVDEEAVHQLSMEDEDVDRIEYIDKELHHMELTPIVRFANRMDLSGRVVGEIAPFITNFARIDQDTQDRLVVQRYGAWAVRTIAGMDKPKTDAEQRAARIALSIGDFMVSEDPETKFGSLPPTPLQGYIQSRESDIRDLAAVSQTPSYQLLGLSDNVGAEGLAAAKDATSKKIFQRRVSAGEGHENSLRLAGFAAGMSDVASDYTSRVHWRNDEAQSFLTLAQGLAQLATALEIPPEMLWERLPDWTQSDTILAKKLGAKRAADALADAQMLAETTAQAKAAAAPKPAAGA